MPDPTISPQSLEQHRVSAGDRPVDPLSPSAPSVTSIASATPRGSDVSIEPESGTHGAGSSGHAGDLESFVTYAYSRKGKRIAMKKQMALSMAQSPPPTEALWRHVQELAKLDIFLSVPRQMLLAALPHKGTTRAWLSVVEACRVALRAHPAFCEIVPLLDAGDKSPDTVEAVLDQAASFRFRTVAIPGSAKPLSASQAALLRANVTGTTALWMVAVRDVASPVVIRSLHERVWSTESRRATALGDTWRRLLDVRDATSLGLACDAFVSAAEQARKDADSARGSENAALRRTADLEAEVARIKGLLEEERRTNENLRSASMQASRDAEAALSHARDDYERLRTRVLRRITREVELLDEGMLALKRQPPKLHVVTDHGDRAVSGLREEIKALQKEAEQ